MPSASYRCPAVDNGVIGSAFAAVVLFAGVVVTRAALIALFQTRLHAAPQPGALARRGGRPLADANPAAPGRAFGWLLATARLFRIEEALGELLAKVLFSSAPPSARWRSRSATCWPSP
jgi:potassium-dependent mechanosensitive channel